MAWAAMTPAIIERPYGWVSDDGWVSDERTTRVARDAPIIYWHRTPAWISHEYAPPRCHSVDSRSPERFRTRQINASRTQGLVRPGREPMSQRRRYVVCVRACVRMQLWRYISLSSKSCSFVIASPSLPISISIYLSFSLIYTVCLAMSVDSHEPGEKETQGRVLDPHHPASPEAGVGTLGSPHGAYEITTSYRDTYGGNRGTSIDGWRSASTSPVKATRTGGDAGQSAPGEAEPGEGAEPVVAPVETTTVRMTGAIMGRVAIAKYNPLEDIAVLTTGQVLRHRDAMESLVGALKACSLDSSRETSHDQLEGLATSSLIATNGGTHLMTVNLIE